MRLMVFLFCLTPLMAWAQANESDSEKPVRKDIPAIPAFPQERSLVAFPVNTYPLGRFLLDVDSLSLDKHDAVHYVLVVRSSGGASTVTFESLRCDKGGMYRLYASAGGDGVWRPFKNNDWRPLSNSKDPRVALAHNFFCDGSALRSREAIIGRLQKNMRLDLDYLDTTHGVRP